MRNKTIVAIHNTANKGKTQTLTWLSDLLVAKYGSKSIKEEEPLRSLKRSDFHIVIDANGIKIGIETQGDPGTGLDSKLELLVQTHQCDLIFCTTRTRGETVDAVRDIANDNDYHLIWTSTYHMETNKTNKVDVNAIKARHLMEFVSELGMLH